MSIVLAEPSNDLALVVDRARTYAEAAQADNTRRAYRVGWNDFTTYCAQHGLESLPATPQNIALYVTHLAERAKLATIRLYLAAIAEKHREAGLERSLSPGNRAASGRTVPFANPLRNQVQSQMNNSNFNLALVLCVAAWLLVGCSGTQSPIDAPDSMPVSAQMRSGSTTSAPAELKPVFGSAGYKTTAPLLYVTNIDASYPNARVYRAKAQDPAPLATIFDGVNIPFGACIDGNGTLYVTNEPATGGPGWVSEYPLGTTKPSKIITDGVKVPGFCAIDAAGNLWVTNIYGPNVTEYLHGAKKPHTVITTGLAYPIGIAIDRSGNLYVGNGFGASQQNVQVYTLGSKSPSRTITNGVTSPCGLAVDANGTLYVANEFQDNVAEYRSGQSDPFQTITQGIKRPGGVTVDKKGTLYVSNIGSNTVAEFAPGSLMPLKRQVNKSLYNPVGIAYYPPLLP
jgi:sugar lactone lactonase YvrE